MNDRRTTAVAALSDFPRGGAAANDPGPLDRDALERAIPYGRRLQARYVAGLAAEAARWVQERVSSALVSLGEGRREAQAVRTLESLGDRQLRDIGIGHRSQIPGVVHGLLARRAAPPPVRFERAGAKPPRREQEPGLDRAA